MRTSARAGSVLEPSGSDVPRCERRAGLSRPVRFGVPRRQVSSSALEGLARCIVV